MKGVVYGLTRETAYDKLEEIIQDYEKAKYQVAFKGYMTNELRVIFNNNDTWEACVPSERRRGRAYNIAYIDHRIDVELLDSVIMPSLKALPFQAWRRF